MDPARDGRDRLAGDDQSSPRRLSGKRALHSRQRQSHMPAQRRARGVLTPERRTAMLPQAVQAHPRALTAAQRRCQVRCDERECGDATLGKVGWGRGRSVTGA
jgi:hypothetical protein